MIRFDLLILVARRNTLSYTGKTLNGRTTINRIGTNWSLTQVGGAMPILHKRVLTPRQIPGWYAKKRDCYGHGVHSARHPKPTAHDRVGEGVYGRVSPSIAAYQSNKQSV
jgi:hypothetical protein